MRTVARWFGPTDRPLLGWVTTQSGEVSSSGVLLLPAVGYQYWSTHRTMRVLAERLATSGHTVLRLDYDGTGDSSGDQWAPERLSAWRASARHGADELRALGCNGLVVIGVRLGGTIALLDGSQLGADSIAAWAPVLSGRRYAREVRLLSEELPTLGDPAGGDDSMTGVVLTGTVFRSETLADLAAITMDDLGSAPAARVLLVGSQEPATATTVDRLRQLGATVEEEAVSGREEVLDLPAEYATVPTPLVDAICAWIGPAARQTRPTRDPDGGISSATMSWRGRQVREEVLELGPGRLIGVLTEPIGGGSGPIAVFLNSGSEPHVGPGRAWVEYARDLALSGYASVRVDFRGWGESPDDGFAPGRPYDAHGEEDTIATIRALEERGHRRVMLVGLCAGAWIGLRVALGQRVAGVVALNPQLYWRPGDPVEATMTETKRRRTGSRRLERLGRKFRVWSLLDRIGHRPWAAVWLDQLRAGDADVLMLFAEGDEGIGYLENRLPRRWKAALRSGRIRVVELPDIDHAMHRAWLRGAVVRELNEHLQRLDRQVRLG